MGPLTALLTMTCVCANPSTDTWSASGYMPIILLPCPASLDGINFVSSALSSLPFPFELHPARPTSQELCCILDPATDMDGLAVCGCEECLGVAIGGCLFSTSALGALATVAVTAHLSSIHVVYIALSRGLVCHTGLTLTFQTCVKPLGPTRITRKPHGTSQTPSPRV